MGYQDPIRGYVDTAAHTTQFHALCVDGPVEGDPYALHHKGEVIWLGPRPGHPYRAVEDDDGIWYYVYADAVDDDLPRCPEDGKQEGHE